jgi:hypothetical protein
MSLIACAPSASRTILLSVNLTEEELTCQRAPRGQLPANASAEMVSKRITAIDETGEDCRQKLDRAKMKVQVTREVIEEMNKKNSK